MQDDTIEIYAIHNEGKSAVAEKLIRTLKTKLANIWLQNLKICILIN